MRGHRRREAWTAKCKWACSLPPYCNICWDGWIAQHRGAFLDSPLPATQPYQALALRDFGGDVVHIMQIGLGTFGTFVRPDEMLWMKQLLESSSWQCSTGALKAIGVDPLEESVGLHQASAEGAAAFSFLLAAIGETKKNVSMFCLPRHARSHVRKRLANDALWKRVQADVELAYLENMASIGSPHRDFASCASQVASLIGADDSLMEERVVPMYTFGDVLQMHNARGCEVLAIDAEGADCAIIRSMMASCMAGNAEWPWVIRFETHRLANFKERDGFAEEQVIESLQEQGYMLVAAGLDAVLVHHQTLLMSTHLAEWADFNFELRCYSCNWLVKPSKPYANREAGKGYSQWRNDKNSCWYCRWCLEGKS